MAVALRITDLAGADEVTTDLYADASGCHPVRTETPAGAKSKTFSVSFRPRFYTSSYELESQKLRSQIGIGAATVSQFCAIVTKTNLLGSDGKPLKLTADGLADVSTRLLNDIITGCIEAINADPTSAAS